MSTVNVSDGKNAMRIFALAFIMVITSLVFYSCSDSDDGIVGAEPKNQLKVIGSATIKKAPDVAIAQIGIENTNKELDPAVDENILKSATVIGVLHEIGVAEKDIQTTSFSMYPQHNYDNPNNITGYWISNQFSVTFRDISKLGIGLQKAIHAGANNVSEVKFTFSDPDSVKREARIKAAQDAQQKAEDIAKTMDVEIKKVINITELSPFNLSSMQWWHVGESEGGIPIEPGELAVTMRIEVIYMIGD